MEIVRRGYLPTDAKEFNEESNELLKKAQRDILFLLERGYPIKSASTFVGNHYLLSERQRLAIVRATAAGNVLEQRWKKQLTEELNGKIIAIDGLNLIITLEVALSGSTLLHCMDGTIRDLAGLRGTYRLIDKTDQAIHLIGEELAAKKIREVIFYLDSPVSNTGRLKQRILDLLSTSPFKVTVELVNNADVILQTQENVVSTDAIILNHCVSWINLAAEIIEERVPGVSCVNLSLSERCQFKLIRKSD